MDGMMKKQIKGGEAVDTRKGVHDNSCFGG
jgi:hypothetical protein